MTLENSKYIFTASVEDIKELKCFINAKNNQVKIDSFYDEVLRPIYKYRNLTDDQLKLIEEIIELTREHLSEE